MTAVIVHILVLCICEKCSIVGKHQRFGGTCYFLLQCRSEWGQGVVKLYIFYSWVYSHTESGPPHFWDVEITLTHTSLSRTPLDKRSARRRNLYLKRHKTVKTQISIPPAGFETANRASERMRTHALDRAATGIGSHFTQAEWKQVTCQTDGKSIGDGCVRSR